LTAYLNYRCSSADECASVSNSNTLMDTIMAVHGNTNLALLPPEPYLLSVIRRNKSHGVLGGVEELPGLAVARKPIRSPIASVFFDSLSGSKSPAAQHGFAAQCEGVICHSETPVRPPPVTRASTSGPLRPTAASQISRTSQCARAENPSKSLPDEDKRSGSETRMWPSFRNWFSYLALNVLTSFRISLPFLRASTIC
jgi:hypothetical protein